MALSIVNWNIAENRTWFVRLEDTGAAILVEIYLSSDNAQSQTNLKASGASGGYGSSLEITLEAESGVAVSLFQEEYDWHLIVSGANGDGTKIFKVREFVEMDEITHPIYRTNPLIEARAAAEINAHTNAKIIRGLPLGTHLPTLEPGDIARIQSVRRSLDEYGQVFEHRITGTTNSLTSDLEVVSFMELKR